MKQQARVNAYHQASRTLAKTRQVVMLYDGAIRLLTQAKEAAAQGDSATRYVKLARVGEIIAVLQSGLDMDSGQAIAHQLQRFYQAMALKILHLHYATKLSDFSDVLEELRQMRMSWDAIDRGETAPIAVPKPDAAAYSA